MLVILAWLGLFFILFLLFYPMGYFIFNTKQAIQDNPLFGPHQGVGVYVINLDRSKARYDMIKENIARLGFPAQRISAVDGSALSKEALIQAVDLVAYNKYLNHLPKNGTIGCSLSHIKVWQALIDSSFEYAVIFEDDVVFEAEKLSSVIEDLVKNHNAWDVVNFNIGLNGSPLMIKALQNDQKLVVYLTRTLSAGAYMINRKAALRLLEKTLPIVIPVDDYFTRGWEFDLKFTGVENPRLVHQAQGVSDIESSQKMAQDNKTLLSFLQKRRFKFQSNLIRFFYALKMYEYARGLLPFRRRAASR